MNRKSSSSLKRSLVATMTLVVLALLISTTTALARGGNAANARSCQHGGWATLVTASGASFASQSACVSYAATGGALKLAQTVTFTSTNPSPVSVGATYTPTATASSALSVVITLDAASTGCSLLSTVVSFASAGTCLINANQAGSATYNAAAQVQQAVTVNASSQALCESYAGTFVGPGPATVWTCVYLSSETHSLWIGPISNQCVADGGSRLATVIFDFLDDAFCLNSVTTQALCESYSGTLDGPASPRIWTCNNVPYSTFGFSWQQPLGVRCIADGGHVLSHTNDGLVGPWEIWCE